MDNQINAIFSQQATGYSPDGLQVLHLSMGWCLGDDTVLLYGLSSGYVFFGRTDYSQAVELLPPCIQLDP
jgi:hypothetical protein